MAESRLRIHAIYRHHLLYNGDGGAQEHAPVAAHEERAQSVAKSHGWELGGTRAMQGECTWKYVYRDLERFSINPKCTKLKSFSFNVLARVVGGEMVLCE